MATKSLCISATFWYFTYQFSSVFLMTLIIFSIDKKYEADILFIHKPLRILTWLMAIIVYLTIYTGALVRHTKSSLAYVLGLFHLMISFLIMRMIGYNFRTEVWRSSLLSDYDYIYTRKNYSDNRTVRYGYTASFILVILLITGALSVITNVNLIIALFHALFITYLFGMIAYFILLMLRTTRSLK